MTNRFKGLDLLDRVPEELWMEAHDVVLEAVIKIGYLPTWGVPLSVSYHFTFSYYSWGSQGKNTEMVCHSLLQWTTFGQTSPPWIVHLRWPHTAWLSFIELNKAVVRVIRLVSSLWVLFQFVCPLMPSCNTYCLTWVSLTLGVGYLFTAAPAKHSHCCLHL